MKSKAICFIVFSAILILNPPAHAATGVKASVRIMAAKRRRARQGKEILERAYAAHDRKETQRLYNLPSQQMPEYRTSSQAGIDTIIGYFVLPEMNKKRLLQIELVVVDSVPIYSAVGDERASVVGIQANRKYTIQLSRENLNQGADQIQMTTDSVVTAKTFGPTLGNTRLYNSSLPISFVESERTQLELDLSAYALQQSESTRETGLRREVPTEVYDYLHFRCSSLFGGL